jgi:hypothetical protein
MLSDNDFALAGVEFICSSSPRLSVITDFSFSASDVKDLKLSLDFIENVALMVAVVCRFKFELQR